MIQLIFFILLGTTFCMKQNVEVAIEFHKFIKEFNREYTTVEETLNRFQIFSENYRYIQDHNNQHHSFALKINQFSDLTHEELNSIFKPINTKNNFCKIKSLTGDSNLIDWRDKGIISPVKNEDGCRSDWAFTTVGVVESLFAIRNKKLNSLSAQELVDCSDSYGNNGCRGGTVDSALNYTADKGITEESDYHYIGHKGTCKKKGNGYKITSCAQVPPNNNTELLYALNKNPIAIAVKANNKNFLNYNSGILRLACGTKDEELDHYVLLVGAGTKNGSPCWIIKNSWGVHWGEKGFAYILRDNKGLCGLTEYSIYPEI